MGQNRAKYEVLFVGLDAHGTDFPDSAVVKLGAHAFVDGPYNLKSTPYSHIL
jgi:hypothetical protein